MLTRRGVGAPAEVAQPDVTWVRGDILDAPSLTDAMRGAQTVVHLAAVTHSCRPGRYLDINVTGTQHVLQAAERAGAERFVHMSTRAIDPDGGAYSRSKYLAEQAVLASSLHTLVLRPAEVYGGGGRDPILSLARSLKRRPFVPVIGDGLYTLSPVHVDDVVTATVAAMTAEAAGGSVYTLAGPEFLTFLQLVSRLERLLGIEAPRKRVQVPAMAAQVALSLLCHLRIGRAVPDQIPRLRSKKSSEIGPAVRDLGFSPRLLEEGLAPLL